MYDSDNEIEETLAECPKCGASIYDDVEQCPRCGEWITGTEYSGGGGKRAFVVVVGSSCCSSSSINGSCGEERALSLPSPPEAARRGPNPLKPAPQPARV